MDVPVMEILKYAGTIIGILGALFSISWFLYRIRTQLDQHENHVKEMNSWKNETTKWKFYMIKYLRELAGRGQPTDIRQQNAELDELLIKSLPSNPITEEEKERFNNYRAMASSKKPFTSEEYNDFKLLAEKFKTELPEETLGKFDNLMSEIFAFVLPVSIDKLESEQRIKSEKTKVRDMVLVRIPIISASESNPKRPPGGKTMLDTLS